MFLYTQFTHGNIDFLPKLLVKACENPPNIVPSAHIIQPIHKMLWFNELPLSPAAILLYAAV